MDLDDAYANAAYIPDAARFPPRWQAEAEAFRARLGPRGAEHRYGAAERAVLDLFLPEGPPRGLIVFIHGGYWLKFDKSTWSHLAAGPLARGWAVAMPSYTLAPAARIGAIAREIAAAVSFAAARVAGPVRLTGHSAGGHLAARAISGPEALLAPDLLARIDRALPISPVADLRPMRRTSMNADLRIDEAEAGTESPVLHRPLGGAEVTVWVGENERPAFIAQARALADAWNAGLVIAPGRHHFDVIAPLADPESDMVARLAD